MSISDISNPEAPSFKTNLRHEFARSIIRGAGLPTEDKDMMLHHNLKNINQLSTSLGKGSKDMTSSAVFKEGGQESSHRNAKIHPETITPVEISAEP